jgi:hypothetical protein
VNLMRGASPSWGARILGAQLGNPDPKSSGYGRRGNVAFRPLMPGMVQVVDERSRYFRTWALEYRRATVNDAAVEDHVRPAAQPDHRHSSGKKSRCMENGVWP